jgi:DNA-directed RNA polymerase subunit E'/Rpb7
MKLEGYCLKEGYVKPDSVEIIEYSPGSIMGENVKFQVSLQCMVCHPVEGMIIDCSVKNVTKAGIRAEISKYEKSPLVIFVARDHHYDNVEFNNIKEDDIIQVKIIGMRFELNDTYVSVIAELI